MLSKSYGTPVMICLLGAVSFWAPFALLFTTLAQSEPVLTINAIALFASLGCFFALKRKTRSRFVGGWMFLGIHLLGPIILNTLLASAGGGPASPDFWSDIGILIAVNLPPVFWLFAGDAGAPSLPLVAIFLLCATAWEQSRPLPAKH